MYEQSAAKLRLEPARLGRHDQPGIGHAEQLIDRRGVQRERHGGLAGVHPALKLPSSPDAADKLDSRIAPWIGDPQYRSQHPVLEQGDIKRAQRIIGLGCGALSELEAVPRPRQVKAEDAWSVGLRISGVAEFADTGKLGQKLRLSLASQVLDESVIGQEPDLACGEKRSQKPVVHLITGVMEVGLAPLESRPQRARRAMVPVGESGGMQLVLHSPFGGRINRAFGLALRKRFCRSFGFELQAAKISR